MYCAPFVRVVTVLGFQGGALTVGRGFQVGQWLPADLVGLVSGKAEHRQQFLDDLVGRFGVVAFGVVVQELAAAERRVREAMSLFTPARASPFPL